MNKEKAQKEAQRLLEEAYVLVRQAEELADTHRFTMSFLDKDYCPRDLSEEELEDDDCDFPINRDWMSVGDGGEWMGSSDRC